MEHTQKEIKIAEGQEVCTCIDCKKEFTPHEVDVECLSCRDGERLYEREDYEGGDYYDTCYSCKGHGSYSIREKQRCKECYDDHVFFSSSEDDIY